MTPTYLMNSLSSPNNSTHPIEQNDHEVHPNLIFSSSPSQASSSSSLSCPIFFNLCQDQTLNYDVEQPNEVEVRKDLLHGGSSNREFLSSPSSIPTMENDINYGLKFSMIWKPDEDKDHDNIIPSDTRTSPSISRSVKWMSSKMRLMKKMMNSSRAVDDRSLMSPHKFQTQQINQPSNMNLEKNHCSSSSNSSPINGNNNIRVCADCNTTKTPLWRSGPRGPKSLCNACGIRQRKARRAMAAAAASSGAFEAPSTQSKINHKKEKGNGKGYTTQYKNKRCKFTSTTPPSGKKLCFEDFTIRLMSKSPAFHRVFPQDEKEAAILLMALSCGLVHGMCSYKFPYYTYRK